MLRRAKIISKKVDGKLTQSVEFDDGSVLNGVMKISIEVEPQKIPKAIIEIIDFEVEIMPVSQQNVST